MIGGSWCVTGAESHPSHLKFHEDHFTMAPKKRVGIGAECTVSLRFLHPKNKVKATIPNQTSTQKLSSLIVQSKEKKTIRREEKDCIVFRHEDFNKPIWCLSSYVKVDVEGPEETFFPLETRPGGGGGGQAAQEGATDGGALDAIMNRNDVEPQDLPIAIQELLDNTHCLDSNTIAAAALAAPMVDDDNMPAPENIADVNSMPNDIMMGWEHSNVCLRRSNVQSNAKPRLLFVTMEQGEPSILQLFEGLFFKSYLQDVIIPKTNDAMSLHEKLTYGEFLRWLGLWFLMATIIGPQRHEFPLSPISAFEGAPLRLGVYMGRNRFADILSALQFTDSQPPAYLDNFWEIRQMVKAWGDNMNTHFRPGYVNCLDESMSVRTNKFTCPGFMFVPRKPWPFGNEYHTVCCCLSGIMWGIDMVEGKDRPRDLGQQQFDDLGATVGLLLRLLLPIFNLGMMVILDSGFCVLKGIVELQKNGVYASALIKKRRYWPKYICGEDIKSHFADKEVGATDAWAGKLDGVPFHIYAMKEPDYIMSLMSTYGTNQRVDRKETLRDWKENGINKTTMFKYPEVIDNHFRYHQSIDDHSAKRHSPISLEVVWATKRWPNRMFAFLLSITEVNCWLAECYFTKQKTASMLDFRKKMAFELIKNHYILEEEQKQADDSRNRRRSKRLESERGHGLVSLPPNKKFCDGRMVAAQSRYPQHKCSRCPRNIHTYC